MKKKSTLIAAIVFVAVVAVIAIVNVVSSGFVFEGTFWSLVPPLVAIALALITKEAYSSLFIGVVLGAFMVSGCNVLKTIDTLMLGESVQLADGSSSKTWGALLGAVDEQAGILVFLVILGIIVALINKSGASRAFGSWAQSHIKTKTGAMVATIALGILIFIDDYFNCLTVGSVMTPVTDSKKISRVKLAYIIDATAAPVCMIAPISSWAAAVSGCFDGAAEYSGIDVFLKAIPYNFYSLFTLLFLFLLAFMGFDYGKMAGFEIKAQNGDLSDLSLSEDEERNLRENGPEEPPKGTILDLIIPIVVLIVLSIWGLLRNGYQSLGGSGSIREAFSETDATVGLPWGSIIALVVIVIFLVIRKVVSFEEAMACVPKGFIAMVPAITILTLATALKTMTNSLGADAFVQALLANADNLQWALPALVFVVACVIAFATGTSWGTFGILVPIVAAIFPETSPLFFVGVSACLAGAVCGDHCSPISDTTIMSSAGAHCNHIDHVETQLPYAISVAAISFVSYILAGVFSLIGITWVSIPVGAAITVAFLFFMKKRQGAGAKAA